MSQHHHHDEHGQKESALLKILEKEKELEDAIAAAKIEADRIIRDAQTKATEMVNSAKREVMTVEQAVLAARTGQTVKKNVIADWEKAEAEEVKKKLAANSSKAVAMIIEAVLPE
ncbi:MAG: hypothetical protein HZA78_06530 [Candidatus Schekmanbacteria bacterium]|nr:hypothetical protein [Candidatus Schekmanbacteria bacterium]